MSEQNFAKAIEESVHDYMSIGEECAQELEESVQDYLAMGEQAKGVETLTADMLPAEVKEAMGLDIFPDDIQNDILALSQKIVEYAQALAQSEEAKAPMFGPPTRYTRPQPSTLNRLADCIASTPSRQIIRDGLRSSSQANRVVRNIPGLRQYSTALRIGTAGAAWAAGALGWNVGCMQRTAPARSGPIPARPGPIPARPGPMRR